MAYVGDIKTIGIVGAGQMGGGIAQVAAASGFDVILVDSALAVAEKAKFRIAEVLSRQVEKGKIDAEARDALLARLTPGRTPDDFGPCDFVIEAATEQLELKLSILRRCDAALAKGRWIASNTSSISLTRLAAATSRPDRVIGMHFMNPPPLMKLVELVRAAQTSDETHALTKALAEKMGKTTTTSGDAPGFLVNRLLVPMLCEAMFALQEGVGSAEDIDAGARLGLTIRWAPSSSAISSVSTPSWQSRTCSTPTSATTSTGPRPCSETTSRQAGSDARQAAAFIRTMAKANANEGRLSSGPPIEETSWDSCASNVRAPSQS